MTREEINKSCNDYIQTKANFRTQEEKEQIINAYINGINYALAHTGWKMIGSEKPNNEEYVLVCSVFLEDETLNNRVRIAKFENNMFTGNIYTDEKVVFWLRINSPFNNTEI